MSLQCLNEMGCGKVCTCFKLLFNFIKLFKESTGVIISDFFYCFYYYFYSATKHEIIQIKNHNLLCSLDPPNQSRMF